MKRTFLKEADVKAEVKKLLKKHNWFWWMPAANGFGQTGVHDFLALRAGVFLTVETKFGSNKPTALQKAFGQSILAETGFSFVVNEKNVHDFATWMETFDRACKEQEEGKQPSNEDGATMLNCIKSLTEMLV